MNWGVNCLCLCLLIKTLRMNANMRLTRFRRGSNFSISENWCTLFEGKYQVISTSSVASLWKWCCITLGGNSFKHFHCSALCILKDRVGIRNSWFQKTRPFANKVQVHMRSLPFFEEQLFFTFPKCWYFLGLNILLKRWVISSCTFWRSYFQLWDDVDFHQSLFQLQESWQYKVRIWLQNFSSTIFIHAWISTVCWFPDFELMKIVAFF